MSRKDQNVRLPGIPFHRHTAGALGHIHRQKISFFLHDIRDLPHGLNRSGHVGAVAYDHCSFSGWQLRQCRHFHISLSVAGQDPGPFPQAGKIPQRPQKTVMLGLSHIDPAVRPVHSPKKQIGALRRPGGEKDPIPSLHSKKPAQTPPAGFHNVFFFRLQTASHLPVRHALCISDERIDHTLRFRPGGGRIVQIDHIVILPED